MNRFRLLLLGADSAGDSMSFDGWPWYPGTAAWVIPTAVSVLALEKIGKRRSALTTVLCKRIEQGRSFLLARRCRDGGWNHGSTRALGYDSDSYPETTGIALLALHGVSGPDVTQGLERGRTALAACQSSEAASWLRLGLGAHGRPTSKLRSSAAQGPTAWRRDGTCGGALADAAQGGTKSVPPYETHPQRSWR